MTRSGAVSAADALRAVHELAPDVEATAELLAMLAIERVAPPVRHAATSVRASVAAPNVMRPVPPTPPSTPQGITRPRVAPSAGGDGQPTVAERLSTTTSAEPPAWMSSAVLLPEAPSRAALKAEPIFARAHARSIVAASVAMRSADGPLDVRVLIDMLSRLEPVRTLPRRPAATLRHGVQLLLDVSGTMEPFAQDVQEIARVVEEVVGGPRTQRLRVQVSPVRSVTTRAHRDEPWRAPARGTPVLIVSDLGIGGDPLERTGPTAADWHSLAKRARAAGCPVVALVPFGAEHWDTALMQVITHIHWDHRVTAGAVRRAIGPGHVTR